MGAGWSNWSGLESATAAVELTPRHPEAVAEAVRTAAEAGRRVKMLGTGHSFTSISAPVDVMMRPDLLTGVTHVDREAMTVTALAGTPLHVLNHELEHLGLSLHNMGDIAEQTLAGATSTGTHGTGGVKASLAAQLAGVELVTGDGTLLAIDRAHPHFDAARLGLGALGILTSVTFEVEPMFGLEAVERRIGWDEAVSTYDEIVASAHHADLYWFPRSDHCQTKTNTRIEPDEIEPLPRFRAWLDDDFLANDVFGLINRVGQRVPSLIAPSNRLCGRLFAERTFSDVPHKVFTSPRTVRFRELEYAVPREVGMAALADCRALIDRHPEWPINWPVEIRQAPADDLVLSTASGRESVYLAFHVWERTDHRAYFAGVEEVLRAYDGRPHWGKVHTRTAEDLAPGYPRWTEFAKARDELDPGRVFTNPYLDRVLGD